MHLWTIAAALQHFSVDFLTKADYTEITWLTVLV